MKTKLDTSTAAERGRAPMIANKPSIEAVLTTHPFFKCLSPHHQRILMDCALLVHFAPGELIFREGDPASRFYIISKGKVAIESYVNERGTVLIETLGSGDTLGWSWLFPPYYWHFDARAVEPTDAVFFFATPLRDECESDPALGYQLMKRMTEVIIDRLHNTRQQLLRSYHLVE